MNFRVTRTSDFVRTLDPVSDEQSVQHPRWVFQTALNRALTAGQPCSHTALGPLTRRAVDIVAAAHPDASADEIADAYSAYDDEHGRDAVAG